MLWIVSKWAKLSLSFKAKHSKDACQKGIRAHPMHTYYKAAIGNKNAHQHTHSIVHHSAQNVTNFENSATGWKATAIAIFVTSIVSNITISNCIANDRNTATYT